MKRTILIPLVFLFLSVLYAKRITPINVPSLFVNGCEYRVVNLKEDNHIQNGGIIEVYNAKNSSKTTIIKVYKSKYNWFVERDIQDVFINKLELINNNIIRVYNEKGEVFDIDTNTFVVKKIE